MLLKDVRLRALRDAPSAFSSTYQKESMLSDADWAERAAQWSGDRSRTFLAKDTNAPCGIAAAYLDQENADLAHLVSMWVTPTHRRLGIGAALMQRIVDWARMQNIPRLTLLVTSNNDAAIRFYEHLGFAMTGKTTPPRQCSLIGRLRDDSGDYLVARPGTTRISILRFKENCRRGAQPSLKEELRGICAVSVARTPTVRKELSHCAIESFPSLRGRYLPCAEIRLAPSLRSTDRCGRSRYQ